MNPQREKVGPNREQLAAAFGMDPADVKVGGGQIENFRKGWANRIMPKSDKAHYFRRVGFDAAVANCGFTAEVRWLYGEGDFQRCKRCEQGRTN